MDGSKLTDNSNADAGVCCNLFSFYTQIGNHSTAFDAKITATHRSCFNGSYIVRFKGGPIQAISSIEAPLSVNILKCQTLAGDLLQCYIDIVMRCIPLHWRFDGSENADCLAKIGQKIFHTSNNTVHFYSAKRIIKKYIREHF
ncbi:hypothetical protein TNIN_394851 [Trichonephila inaurata madagascariensis]|uniref:Uncharacterized protein n=1 Tax=Trichonephila inaurata madagascariensis TaxID=2747483 RepID=A0A8X6YHY2_9ARAC|nr:hypothetical protein TNIN_394851 [Trichonephila inaurata madagascariensis]